MRRGTRQRNKSYEERKNKETESIPEATSLRPLKLDESKMTEVMAGLFNLCD